MIASAILFLVVLFFVKNKSLVQNIANYTKGGGAPEGLVYENKLVVDLVNRDLDDDGVLDWEESLWGTDPTTKDTNGDGVEDGVEVEKLKKETQENNGIAEGDISGEGTENLTETDRFSREFFATVATLNQNGDLDEATIQKLGESLSDHIKNSPQRRVFTNADIKIINDASPTAIKKYTDTLDYIIDKKYPSNHTTMDIMQRFVIDEDNVDVSVLEEFDPIIEQKTKIISEVAKMDVPSSISREHVELLNGMERILENVSDMKLYDQDSIVALAGISQYETNTALLEEAVNNLRNAIEN